MRSGMIVAVVILSLATLSAATSAWSQESATPAAQSAPASTTPALSSAATATPAAVSASPAAAPKREEKTSYIVFRTGQWSLQSDNLTNENSRSYAEIAFGGKFNPYFGAEFGVGYFTADAQYHKLTADVTTMPVLLSLRLGVPIAIVEPYALLGGGAYFTKIDVGSASTSTVKAGYHVGLGVDVALGSFLVGIEARYFSTTAKTFDANISLDGYLLAAKAGIRF